MAKWRSRFGRALALGLGAVLISALTAPAAGDPAILVGPQGGTSQFGEDFGLAVLPGGTRPFSYQWYFQAALPAGNTNVIALPGQTDVLLWLTNVTSSQSGAYWVVVSNAGGSVTSAPATLVVSDPVMVAPPQGGTAAAEGDFTFAVEAAGTEPLSYQWYFNGEPLTGQTSNTLVVATLSATNAGNYYVTVSNAMGMATSSSANLTVEDPLIVTQPEGGVVDAGGDFTFEVEAAGSAPLTYQWYFNRAALAGKTNGTLLLTNVTVAQSGSYFVDVYDEWGTVRSATASLTVYELAILTQPLGGDIDWNEDCTFAVEAAGTPTLRYQWYFNGAEIANATADTLVLTGVTGANSGLYSVRVTNQWGSVASLNTALTVHDPIIRAAPVGGTVDAGDSFTLTVGAVGSPPLTYQWYFNDAALAGKTNNVLSLTNVTTAQSGQYAADVRNGFGVVRSAAATLTVYDLAIVAQPQGGWVAGGDDFSLSVEARGTPPLTYQWYFQGAPLTGQTSNVLSLTSVTTDNSGTYAVAASNGAGTRWSDTVRLAVFEPVIRTQPRGGEIEAGTNFTFTVVAGGNPPFTYQWFFNGAPLVESTTSLSSNSLPLTNVMAAQSGTYYVVVTTAAGSLRSDNAVLTVDDPAILSQPTGGRVSAGTNFTFTVTAAGTSPLTYQWLFNGAPLTNQAAPILMLTNLTAAQSGSYSVRVTNPNGSRTSAAAGLQVDDPAIVLQPVGGQAALHENFRFDVTAAGSQPIIYQWYFQGAPLPGEVNRTLELDDLSFAQSGPYSVLVRSAEGSVMSSSANLTVVTDVPRTLLTGQFLTQAVNQVSVEIVLTGNGVENGVTFSMRYDSNVLTSPMFVPNFPATVTTTNDSVVRTNLTVSSTNADVTVTNVFTNAVIGVTIQLTTGSTFPATNTGIGWLQFQVMPGQDPMFGGFAFADTPLPITASGLQQPSLLLNARVMPAFIGLPGVIDTNTQSGLVTDYFLLANPGTEFLYEFLVGVRGLGTDSLGHPIRLYNAQGIGSVDTNRDGVDDTTVDYVQIDSLPPGARIPLTMEYYVADHLTVPEPIYFLSLDQFLILPSAYGNPVPVRGLNDVDGHWQLEFSTQLNHDYFIQYADQWDDLSNELSFNTAQPVVHGTGATIRWVDTGPPKTLPPETPAPPLPTMRLYRVIETP